MSDAHWHLLVNHLPVLGVPFGVAVLAVGLPWRNVTLQRAGLILFALSGLTAGIAYLTGEPAEHALEHLAGRPESLIEAHEEAALVATIATAVLALVSAAGLWRLRRLTLSPVWGAGTIVLALGVALTLAWTATLGGRISHPEIRPGGEVAAWRGGED